MKRSEALTPLSHDHHQALFVAQRLRRAESVEAVREEFAAYWAEHGHDHFRVEEDVLLPMWARYGEVDHEHVERIAREHLEIRAAALRAAEGTLDLAGYQRLGKLLSEHVRHEERVVFPLIESQLSEEEAELVGAAIREAEGHE